VLTPNQAQHSVFGILANNSYANFGILAIPTAKKFVELPKL